VLQLKITRKYSSLETWAWEDNIKMEVKATGH
jgi:hypothetical protein